MSILAYNSFMITPVGSPTNYQGMWQNGTSGYGSFASEEKGYTDEYAINFGGNISNIVYWGMGFGITDLEYRQSVYYTEDMENASILYSLTTMETPSAPPRAGVVSALTAGNIYGAAGSTSRSVP